MDKKSLKKRNLAELDLVLEEIIQRNPDWVDQVEKIVKECKMNELIKQLEKQCWSHRVDGVLIDGHLHFDTKKFAELIVYDFLSELTNDDTLGEARITTIQRLAKKWGVYK